jgi:integrase
MCPPEPVDFSDFAPDPLVAGASEWMDRRGLAGLGPEEAAGRIMRFCDFRKPIREITRLQKERDLKILFEFLAQKRKDIGNVDSQMVQTLREYLRLRVQKRVYAESYASHLVKTWNSVMRLAFGEEGQPGEGLIMVGFPMRVRKVERLDEKELEALISAAAKLKCRSKVDKNAFQTYLEVERCSGNRVGSLVYVVNGQIAEAATFQDIDWEKGILRLRHMKNRPEHTVVLTPAALASLRAQETNLRAQGLWAGLETPILLARSGRALRPSAINRLLSRTAVLAGITKPVTTHVLRKSVGTHIGRYNARYAAEQLGITMRVFETHYNQPTVEDRLTRRDILPGSAWQPTAPEEIAGRAWLLHAQGLISEAEFQAILHRADVLRSLPAKKGVPETSPYQ